MNPIIAHRHGWHILVGVASFAWGCNDKSCEPNPSGDTSDAEIGDSADGVEVSDTTGTIPEYETVTAADTTDGTSDGTADETVADTASDADDASPPKWDYFPKSYGANGAGASYEVGRSIFQRPDGGYIVAGISQSFPPVSGGVAGPHVWLLGLAWNGDIEWQRAYGVADYSEQALVIRPVLDAGGALSAFYVVGASRPVAGGAAEAIVFKFDGAAALLWMNRYGTADGDAWWNGARVTAGGGLVLAGQLQVAVGGIGVLTRAWVAELDPSGAVVWQAAYGPALGDALASDVELSHDGSYLVTGHTPAGALVMDVSAAGIRWQQVWGGANHTPTAITEVGVTGATPRWDPVVVGEVVTTVVSPPTTLNDAWAMRLRGADAPSLDGPSAALWQLRYPWGSLTRARALALGADGRLLLAGEMAFGPMLTARVFELAVDLATGAPVWGKSFSSMASAPDSSAYGVIAVGTDAAAGPGYMLVGNTWNSAEPTGSYWLVRTTADGGIPGMGCPDGVTADATSTPVATLATLAPTGTTAVTATPLTSEVVVHPVTLATIVTTTTVTTATPQCPFP